MSSDEIKVKKKSRGNIKRLLTCSETLLASINEDSDLEPLNLEGRLEKHIPLWNQFDIVQSELEKLLPEDTKTAGHDGERTSLENRYHLI